MAKLFCENCHNWQRLAQPGRKPVGWCPKQQRRMYGDQFCMDHFDPVYQVPDMGGQCHAQGPPH